jgi:hypothetical protein
MKKHIIPKDLPDILDEETIMILAKMANEIPQSEEWHKIFDMLSYENISMIMEKRIEIQNLESKQLKSQMTEEEKNINEQKKLEFLKKLEEDPHLFFGNMSRPDTPEEFKSRFGVWPDGTNGKEFKPKK